MKIIFLDIDGVLNSSESFHENYLRKLKEDRFSISKNYCFPLGHLSIPHIQRLNRIIEETNSSIVISSTWRNNSLKDLRNWLSTKGFLFKDQIIDKTPNFHLSYGRGYEIQDWLNNSSNVTNFVILDDDIDMHHLLPYLVHTDQRYGLQEEETQLAIDLLNGKIETVPLWERRSELVKHYTTDVWNAA